MKRITAKLQLPQGRILALVGVTVLLVTLALGIVLWRFGVAGALDRTAVTKGQAQVLAQEARVALAEEGGLADAYGSDKAAADLRALQAARLNLGTALAGIERISRGQERSAVVSIRSASARLDATFGRYVAPVAGTRHFDRGVAVFGGQLSTVSHRLDVLADGFGTQAAQANATALNGAASARLVGVLMGVLAVLAALFVGWYTRSLIGKLFRRLDRQLAQIDGQLSHIDHVSESASSLAAAAAEMHASMAQSAAATTEQSAAITQVSSTIEELSATASAIADRTRAGTAAAEQTGETMEEMQEKVEAISQRSLRLGERAQKIGEVVELIQQIAEQTDLLALNAAIEAARAGEAGAGFAVVASEVRKLSERSMRSAESIRQTITAVQDETNATILATEQGAKQAMEVGELMRSTADLLEQSIESTDQQQEAARQVAGAMTEIRAAAEQLAGEHRQRTVVAQQVETLVHDLERRLAELSAAGRGNVHRTPASPGIANGAGVNGVALPSSPIVGASGAFASPRVGS